MKKFEYQQVDYSNYPSPTELNEEGADGWEWIHIHESKKTYYDYELEDYVTKKIYTVTFKREIQYGKYSN